MCVCVFFFLRHAGKGTVLQCDGGVNSPERCINDLAARNVQAQTFSLHNNALDCIAAMKALNTEGTKRYALVSVWSWNHAGRAAILKENYEE